MTPGLSLEKLASFAGRPGPLLLVIADGVGVAPAGPSHAVTEAANDIMLFAGNSTFCFADGCNYCCCIQWFNCMNIYYFNTDTFFF